jgi:hypothetical protein
LDLDGRVILEDIFRFNQRSVNADGKVEGEMVMTGYIPSFIPDLINKGLIEEGSMV